MPIPPPIEPQPQPTVSSMPASSSCPAMENHETECYVLQSLELLADLATTPTNQYCGPESDRCVEAWASTNADGSFQDGVVTPRSLLAASSVQRYDPWQPDHSFQQVYQRTIEGQRQQIRPKPMYNISLPAASSSPTAPAPIEPQSNYYHSNTMPQYSPSIDSNDSQHKGEEPSLKRIRNTAASARFRAKKKRREQQLEQESRDTRENLHRMENRITELETENRWLKNLIMDKSEAKMRKEQLNVEADDRKGSEHKDGVGTNDQ